MDVRISSFAVLRTSKEAFPQDSESLILLPFCKTLCVQESQKLNSLSSPGFTYSQLQVHLI